MTLAELRQAALQEAGISTPSEPVDADDDQLVATKYESLYDMLLSEGLVAWAATDDIPEFAEQPVTMMLAAVIASSFGMTGQRMNELRLAGSLGLKPASLAEQMLRRQLAKKYVPHPVKAQYF